MMQSLPDGRLFFCDWNMTRIVRGYHGTTHSSALDIVNRRSAFQLSDSPGDWLGRGAYFFEENERKAIEWAFVQVNLRARLGSYDSAALIVADLDLSRCLDLCSGAWHAPMQLAAGKLLASGVALQKAPELTTAANLLVSIGDARVATIPGLTGDEHFTDKAVVDALVADLNANKTVITTVRASFTVGRQSYTNGYFFSDTHVQIAVLDPDAVVTNMRIIHPVPTASP